MHPWKREWGQGRGLGPGDGLQGDDDVADGFSAGGHGNRGPLVDLRRVCIGIGEVVLAVVERAEHVPTRVPPNPYLLDLHSRPIAYPLVGMMLMRTSKLKRVT